MSFEEFKHEISRKINFEKMIVREIIFRAIEFEKFTFEKMHSRNLHVILWKWPMNFAL